MCMNKVQPESGSGKSHENSKAQKAWEIPDDERIKKKVLLLELALMHRPTAASLTKPQLEMAAKKCILIEVGEDGKLLCDMDGRTTDESTTLTPFTKAHESGSRFVRYNGLLVLEKVQKTKFAKGKIQNQDKSIQFFEDKISKKTYKDNISKKTAKEEKTHCCLSLGTTETEQLLLFIPEPVEKAIYGRYYTPRGVKNKEGKQKPNSICGRYDPVSKRLRYWWAENKCYRYFMIWLAIHLVMLIAYHVVSATMRNDMMESIKGYKKDAKGKGHLQAFHDDISNVEVKVSKLKCKVVLTSEKSLESTGHNYARDGLKTFIPLLEWPGLTKGRRGFAKNGYSYYLGNALQLAETSNGRTKRTFEPIRKTYGNKTETGQSSEACVFYLFIDKTSNMTVTVRLGIDAEVDIQGFNYNGPRTYLNVLKTKMSKSTTVIGTVEKSKFGSINIDTHSTAVQLADIEVSDLKIKADAGWAYVETLNDLDLTITNATGKCLKGAHISETKGLHFSIRNTAHSDYVVKRDYGYIDIQNGMVFYTRKEEYGVETPLYKMLHRANNNLGEEYNISSGDLNLVNRALDTVHPVLKLTQFDLRAPHLENVTYFASHAMVFRLRPVFLAIASAGLLMSTKTEVQVVVNDSPCASKYEKKMCSIDKNSSIAGRVYDCKLAAGSGVQKLAVYDDVQAYLRDTFFKPLETDLERLWIKKAGYENYVFAAQEHTGQHMFDLMAWVYNIYTDSFDRQDKISPRPVGISLIVLSSSICFILLVIFGILLVLFLANAEKEVITNTLFNDPEFLKDMKHTMEIAKIHLKEIIGDDDGVDETDIFRLTFLCCKDRARCICDLRCCRPTCDNPEQLRACCSCCSKQQYYVALEAGAESKRRRTKSFCCCFRRCCGLGYVPDRRKTRIADIADTGSSWFQGLRNITEGENFLKREEKEDGTEIIENMYRHSFHGSVNRLIKKAALVQSYTDLMFFVEMYFPNAEMSLTPTAEEVLYSEMDHEYAYLDFIVIIAQMLTAGILVFPSTAFAILWSGLETYYYSDLANGLPDGSLRDFYCESVLNIPMPTINLSDTSSLMYGYLRFTLPSLIVASIIIVFFLTEMYNFFDMYVLHGTKYELGEYGHRLLEWRMISEEQQARSDAYGDDSSFLSWKNIPFEYIRPPPPLENGHKNCPCYKFGNYKVCGALAVGFTWFCPWRKCFCKCRQNDESKLKTYFPGDIVEVMLPGWENRFIGMITNATDNEGNNAEPGDCWNRCCNPESNDTFTVSFFNPSVAAELAILFAMVGKEGDKEFEPNVGDLILVKVVKAGEESEGDKNKEDREGGKTKAGEERKVGIYMGKIIEKEAERQKITEKEADKLNETDETGSERGDKKAKRQKIIEKEVDISNETDETGSERDDKSASDKEGKNWRIRYINIAEDGNKKADKEFKTADNKFKMDAYHKYGNPKWFEELYTLTEDIKEFDMKNIVSGFHVYPIESWWDSKEGLKEYSDFQMTYRKFNNIFRVLVGIVSYTYFLVTAMWCTLGLFLLPERVGPYATAIFVISGNAKTIYDHLINQAETIKLHFVEKIREQEESKAAKEFINTWEELDKKKEDAGEEEGKNHTRLQRYAEDFAKNPNPVTAASFLYTLENISVHDKKISDEYKEVTAKMETYEKGFNVAIQVIEQYQNKVLKKFGFSRRGAIMSVVIASVTLFVILTFLIIGMNTFSGEDAFSAAIASSLSVAAGFTINKRARQMENIDGAILEEKVAAMVKLYNEILNRSGNAALGLDDELTAETITKKRNQAAETKNQVKEE